MARRSLATAVAVTAAIGIGGAAAALAATPGPDVRLTNDNQPGTGYVSNYTQVTGTPYTDATLTECSGSRGRQNEPAVAIDPRNTQVIVGSSNDYCGVYNATASDGTPLAIGPIWVGNYRSENAGASFVSSLVPGYPGDTSPYAARSQLRTAGSGDPVLAWDNHGRVFEGIETSEDPAGTKKGFGDQGVATYENPDGPGGATIRDGKEFKRTTLVARGASAPGTGGKFLDKTAIEADRTGGRCDANVYFAYSRFTGAQQSNIYFMRSTNHGVSFSTPALLTPNVKSVQGADISVTHNGNVYVTWNAERGPSAADEAIEYAKSTDCGKTFSKPRTLVTYTTYEAQDVGAPTPAPAQARADDPPSAEGSEAAGSLARDCGDFDAACASGYTFFRRGTQARSTADQRANDENVYVVYDPTKPGTEVSTGTTYGSIAPGTGSQSGIYFVRLNGATGAVTAPKLIDNEARGHQLFPDIAVEGGALHTLWWDSRNDPQYSPMRPVGNDAAGNTYPSLDTYGAASSDGGATWSVAARMSDVTTNPNYEQFSGRTVPFAGDYLWISAVGNATYGTWTDWRDTVAGVDQRESGADDGDAGADVLQCRTGDASSGFGSDRCPRAGGLDQNIYGDVTP